MIVKRQKYHQFIKKKDQLSKDNYRPISILTSLSKVLEGIMCDQLMAFIEDKLSKLLAAYRPLYSCTIKLYRRMESCIR